MFTDITSAERLVQKTIVGHLRDVRRWARIHAVDDGVFGSTGTLGCASEREMVLVRDLCAARDLLLPRLMNGGIAA